MKILFIYRHPQLGYSFGKVFHPIEEEMKNYASVDSFYMPVPDYSPAGLLKNIRSVIEYCKNKKYDVIHITGTEHYLLPFLRRQKVVVTVHDFGHFFELRGFHKWKFWIIQIASLRYANAITCISDYTVSEIKRIPTIPKDKIVVIPNAVEGTFILYPKKFNSQSPVVLHIGTRPHKNLSRTIKALKGIECELRIVGKVDGSDIELMNMNDIHYTAVQDLSNEELLQEYKNADIINFPSYHEGFGMPIIEAQAIGRLVITSDIEPMKSVAGNGAILCNPYDVKSIRDAYLRGIDDETYRKEIVKAGMENVRKYRAGIIAKQYFELYQSL